MLNPVLKFEGKVQSQDQTRFDASKSFITKGDTALTAITIKPGDDGSAVSIFDADPANWFLDWVWEGFKIDVDALKNKIKFVSNGVTYTATITVGTYTLPALQLEILTQLNLASSVVWALALSLKNEYLLTASERVTLKSSDLDASLLPFIGFNFSAELTDTSFQGSTIDALPRNVTLTLDNGTPVGQVFTQKVFSPEGDALFSSDADLVVHEPQILDWVSVGRNSFIDAHRRSQEKIMQFIDQNGYLSNMGKRINKFQLLDLEDVRLWSVYMTLHHLFISFQNSKDDVLKDKSKYYEALMISARNQAVLVIDFNNNGKAEPEERVTTWSGSVRMR